ncbi:BPL-N domain-containing protein [Deinococcus ruber]|uniref:Biotin-protein ligase N-terminal domain-containing protein n=1 Tax=Deinococcus ruber TaxID=1848197 RepID=A0A918C7D4_9DEIO|nr:BPL-N domain-containing protein [Deinococcus ruber]GGR10595.1 hypothetical protein GCM10008957_24130 [Deinococcus ruber]
MSESQLAPAWWTSVQQELAPLMPGLRVAFYASGGAPYHHAALVAHWGGVPVPLSADAIATGALAGFDVLIVPGGGLYGMSGLLEPLGNDGAARIRAWVEAGGLYIGSCAGAYLPAHWPESFAQQHPRQQALQLLDVPMANAADAGLGGLDSPGVGVVRAQRVPEHWLTAGLPDHFEVVHYNGPCFLPTTATGVTRLVGYGSAFTPWEHAQTPDAPGEVLIDRLIRQGACNVVAGSCGEGTVVLFGSHPEFGFGAVQLGWGVAARMFGNALGYQARRVGAAHAEERHDLSKSGPTPDLPRLADDFLRASTRLAGHSLPDAALPGAPGFLGRTAPALAAESLAEASQLCHRIGVALHGLARASPVPDHLAHWLFSTPEGTQDYGFVGLAQLAAQIHHLIDLAQQRLQHSADFTSPYGDWDQHPYHLLASSYLSAAGIAASAALATGTLISLGHYDLPSPYDLFSPDSSAHTGVNA